jgi:pullulanase
MPNYYFRYVSGNPSNGSGCGNETASELSMFRKFMIDSTEFLAKEYKLGGFRFDLMGLHDVETMNQLVANLHEKVDETITVYGEPWAGGTSALYSPHVSAVQANMNQYKGFGCFNDKMRDALIKGGLNSATAKGWVTNNSTVNSIDVNELINGFKGITLSKETDPSKSISYVTCHDNYTLYDRIKASGTTNEILVKRMAMLANSCVFTSQGISFMLAGEEMLRTKGGNSNSYEASYAVNAIDYTLKVKHLDMFNNYKALIALKQNANVFGKDAQQIASDVTIEQNDNGSLIIMRVKDTLNKVEYIICHSNGVSGTKVVNLEGYTLYLDTLNQSTLQLTTSTTISPYQTIIATKSYE